MYKGDERWETIFFIASTLAQAAEEGVQHRLLGGVAHRQQRADERGQRQLARAGKGVGMVVVARRSGELGRVDALAQLGEQGLKG